MSSHLLRCLKTRVNRLIGHRNLSRTLTPTPATNSSPFALTRRHGNLSQTLTPTPNPSSFALLALRPFSSRPIDNSPLPFHTSTEIDDNGFRWDLKELASDQTLWALYERWIVHFDLARDPDEKLKRFEIFKEKIRRILNHNRRRPDPEFSICGINQFTDSDPDKGYPMFGKPFSGEKSEMIYADMRYEQVEESEDEKGQKQLTCTIVIEDSGDDDCYGCFLARRQAF